MFLSLIDICSKFARLQFKFVSNRVTNQMTIIADSNQSGVNTELNKLKIAGICRFLSCKVGFPTISKFVKAIPKWLQSLAIFGEMQ